jgi:hypothetical protein
MPRRRQFFDTDRGHGHAVLIRLDFLRYANDHEQLQITLDAWNTAELNGDPLS